MLATTINYQQSNKQPPDSCSVKSIINDLFWQIRGALDKKRFFLGIFPQCQNPPPPPPPPPTPPSPLLGAPRSENKTRGDFFLRRKNGLFFWVILGILGAIFLNKRFGNWKLKKKSPKLEIEKKIPKNPGFFLESAPKDQ